MENHLKSCVVTTTEQAAGDVVGRLNKIGAWLRHMDRVNELIQIQVDIPELEIKQFSEWFIVFTNGEGKFNENA
jgi:translation elongation factor EF-G